MTNTAIFSITTRPHTSQYVHFEIHTWRSVQQILNDVFCWYHTQDSNNAAIQQYCQNFLTQAPGIPTLACSFTLSRSPLSGRFSLRKSLIRSTIGNQSILIFLYSGLVILMHLLFYWQRIGVVF